VAAQFPEFLALLDRERLEAERRPLRMRVDNLNCALEEGNVRLLPSSSRLIRHRGSA